MKFIEKLSLILISLIILIPIAISIYGIEADISVTEPSDGAWATSGTVTFGMVCEEGVETTQNATFWLNDITALPTLSYYVNATNGTIENYSANLGKVWNTSIGLPDGTHYYYAECNNNSNTQSVETAVRSLNIDSAVPTVYLQYPKSNETAGTFTKFNGTANSIGWDGESLTVYFNVTDTNIAGCNVSSNTTTETVTGITSQANTSATIGLVGTSSTSGPATIAVVCWDDAGNIGTTDTNVSVSYDAVEPTFTYNVTSPGIRNNQWETSTNITEINISVIDDNVASCDLYFYNVAGTATFNRTIAPTNSTVITFDSIIAEADNNTGFSYYVTCNDTFDHTVTGNTQTFFVDSVKPGTVTMDWPAQYTYVNDTLAFKTNASDKTDLNYNHSTLYICKDSACSTTLVTAINFTGNITKIDIPVNVTRTDDWYFNISNTDHAGQATGSSNGTLLFYTDSKYMTLNAGWSILAYVRHTLGITTSVGTVYAELTAGSKQVCRFNSTWNCYAGVANYIQHENFSDYEPIVIWVNETTDWGAVYYLNTTTFATEGAENYTFVNETATKWNLFSPGFEDGVALRGLNDTLKWNNSAASPAAVDGVMLGISLFNNSATANQSKYVPYIPDWEWSADAVVDYRAVVFGIQNFTFFDQQAVSWVYNRSRTA